MSWEIVDTYSFMYSCKHIAWINGVTCKKLSDLKSSYLSHTTTICACGILRGTFDNKSFSNMNFIINWSIISKISGCSSPGTCIFESKWETKKSCSLTKGAKMGMLVQYCPHIYYVIHICMCASLLATVNLHTLTTERANTHIKWELKSITLPVFSLYSMTVLSWQIRWAVKGACSSTTSR